MALAGLAWASCIPLLVPFGAYRNVDLQGLVLILAGVSAWGALLLQPSRFPPFDPMAKVLLAIFAITCLLSTALTPHLSYNLLGSPYIRLGSLGLLSCIGIGILCSHIARFKLAGYLYCYIVVIVTASLLYEASYRSGAYRIGGVFDQADIFAVMLGCGLLLGWQFCSRQSRTGRAVIGVQIIMAGLLVLTQTRAGLLLTILLSSWLLYRTKRVKARAIGVGLVGLLVCVALATQLLPDNRLHDTAYAKASVTYRLQLNSAALISSWQRPIFGYGPGNLADALDCKTLTAQPLEASCHNGFFFNSSHNIYLDRALGLGWLAGIIYVLLVLLSLIRGRSALDIQAVRLLISLYYLTNVTSIALELLFWVLLVQGLLHGRKHAA